MSILNITYCIVVPCFNEENRILGEEYIAFTKKHPEFYFLFVDDGSVDQTFNVINDLSKQSSQINALKLSKNKGKAEAVREGVNYVLTKHKYTYVGYLDADLAIPFTELIRLKEKIYEGYAFTFSSKKETEKSELNIQFKRFFIGRVLSQMVSLSLRLDIYDTQCGCKLMTTDIAETVFEKKFNSAWLFDVEIIWRILEKYGRPFFEQKAIEVPVFKLIDRGSSRIKASDLLFLPFEFIKIHFYYARKC